MFTEAGAGGVPEQIYVMADAVSRLNCVIAIHSTALGPASGGCRLWSYDSHEAMTSDACRLAQGMSYKNALAGLALGGGKAVLRVPADPFSRRDLFAAFGRAVASLRGDYVTAEDVGTSVADMSVVAAETRFVAGLPARAGRAGGDPSPWTALGVFLAMRLAVERRLERDLSDCTVAIQGVGHVGAELARLLADAGAKLIVADVNIAAAVRVGRQVGGMVVDADDIHVADANVFAPCALGGVLNERTIGRLAAKVVCGAANNQLAQPGDAGRLADRNILYTPDFVVNAGGIVNVAAEYLGWSPEVACGRIEQTPARLADVLARAARDGITPHAAAEMLARERIAAGAIAERAAA